MENVITDVKVLQDGSAFDVKIASTLDKLANNSDKMTNALEQIGRNSENMLDLIHPGKLYITIEGEGERTLRIARGATAVTTVSFLKECKKRRRR